VTSTKVRKTLTLDAELVDLYGTDDQALSTAVNAALHRDAARQARQEALREYVAELGAMFGEPANEDVAYFTQLLTS